MPLTAHYYFNFRINIPGVDKFKAMRTFVHIADEGSLTAAAAVTGSSLPAVVRSLAAYEVELGVRLFNRTTRRMSLTEEGKQHLQNSRQGLAAVEESEATLSAGASEPAAGHLTVTAPVLFGQMWIAPAVTRFVRQHEKMRCSLVLLDRVVNLLEEGLDLGIRALGSEIDYSRYMLQQFVFLPVGRVVLASGLRFGTLHT